MYGERTEQLISEVQGKLSVSREEVLAKAPAGFTTLAKMNLEKPLGGFLKTLLENIEAGINPSTQDVMTQQMQKDFDKHPEYTTVINKALANPALVEKVSQALGISSNPKELGYDPATGAFDANKAAAAVLGAKAPEPEVVQALSEEVQTVLSAGEVAPESSDAAAGGPHS